MLSIPTAPFAEHYVIEHIERFIARRKRAVLTRDRAGNLLVHVKQGRRSIRRPVCITAHLDHPGFVAETMLPRRPHEQGERASSRRVVRSTPSHARGAKKDAHFVRAFWRGRVPKEYFVGSRVRFFVGESAGGQSVLSQKSRRSTIADGGGDARAGTCVLGVVRSITTSQSGGSERVDRAVIEVPRPVPAGTIGMWDLPGPRIRGSRIYARGCDDIAGASAMLCAIDELVRTRRTCDAYFLFTRAEEVGFAGAIAAAKDKTIPAKCFVVAMETSSERANAHMGDGPILRVGDLTSTFTHAVTAHCHRVAGALERDDKAFRVQRKLMDGGTCESSAFCALGYEATGLCIALGNYHNVDADARKLGPEYVHLKDFENVVKWFVALARSPIAFTGRDETLHARLKEIERNYRTLLLRSREKAC